MHKARSFFFVCAGIFLLAAAYHLGAMSARAQSGGPVVEVAALNPGSGNRTPIFVMASGDYYASTSAYNSSGPFPYRGNILSGPTPATQSTWGQVKSRYRQDGTAKQAQDK